VVSSSTRVGARSQCGCGEGGPQENAPRAARARPTRRTNSTIPPVERFLDTSELSREAGLTNDRLEWLVRIGILKPHERARYRPGDVFRAKMIAALLEAGIGEDQIEWAASAGSLNLDHIDRYILVEPTPRSPRSYAEFSSEDSRRKALLSGIYQYLGLAQPEAQSNLTQLEEELFDQFFRAWSLAANNETLIRAARLVAQGTRQAVVGWLELFEEQVAGPARDRLLRGEVQTYPAEVSRSSTLLIPLLPRLMTWLTQRYVEQTVVAGIVEGFEAFLASRGLVPEPDPAGPPAVVFADVSGYTSLTEEHGDETAVRIAESLQQRAEAAAAAHGGRLVKMLGDGAMLHFPDADEGVQAAMELVRPLAGHLDVRAHAGVDVGPVIERDRDVFGATVNLASRIAALAGPGEVLASEPAAAAVDLAALGFEPVEDVKLKGIGEPVRLFRAS
jgi:adenylate cyclase